MQRVLTSTFADALVSETPSAEIGERERDFDWIVGGWSGTTRDFKEDGSVFESTGEWWFSWVLEGRAIQDVWIVPRRADRTGASRVYNRYGTTIRYYDAQQGLWRIVWINPISGIKSELAGRRHDNRIVLEGVNETGSMRWSFNDITPTRFIWRGEEQRADGSWFLGAEFTLTKKV